MNDGKVHFPARMKSYVDNNRPAVRVYGEAYNALVDIYNESTVSMMQIASELILFAAPYVVFDKAGAADGHESEREVQ